MSPAPNRSDSRIDDYWSKERMLNAVEIPMSAVDSLSAENRSVPTRAEPGPEPERNTQPAGPEGTWSEGDTDTEED